ncbi:MAG: epoxide hydrolase N-terminal domain-containing protein, partial [Rhizobiales bacterium]|nr:epoxide hydrolase N-terminal domain-containing protein [Hyphomicrobiales bacterium]
MPDHAVTPFRVDVAQDVLDTIRAKVRAYDWHEMPEIAPGEDRWAYGTDMRYLRALCDHWLDAYDWRGAEAALNRHPQFTATIDGQMIHFLHIRGSGSGDDALLLTHGWPGSVYEFHDVIDRPELAIAAHSPMKRVLDQILASVDGRKPVWMSEPDDFVSAVALRAPQEFDRAFDRWRELYNSARTQLMEANARSEITGLSGADRRRIKAAQMQASDQITILEQGKASNGSDFYSYRYLATEGFLPGYNFPRLPLYAFIPGDGKTGSFLQRARFLAISEFGPRSLIYHEGRAYRVMKAKLPPEVRTGDGSELATRDIFICSNCGACHDGEVERCHACNAPMAGEMPVQRTLRIDNVEAAPTER